MFRTPNAGVLKASLARLDGSPAYRRRNGSSLPLQVAQWIEHQPHKLTVAGSIPALHAFARGAC